MVTAVARGLARLLAVTRHLVRVTGKLVAWFTLLMVAATFATVILRYGMNQGWIWLQESVSYMHAAVFMTAAAWTLQEDAHVRVDIFYRDAGPRHKALVNVAGALVLLLPFCLFLILMGWDYVAASWQLKETSREASGLPFVYLLKSLILLMPVLLLLQTVCDLDRDVRCLLGKD